MVKFYLSLQSKKNVVLNILQKFLHKNPHELPVFKYSNLINFFPVDVVIYVFYLFFLFA